MFGFSGVVQAYDGKVRKDLDHDQLMPAAWRLEKYLDADGGDSLLIHSFLRQQNTQSRTAGVLKGPGSTRHGGFIQPCY